MKATPLSATLLVLSLVGQPGCRHIGPRTIVSDRVRYNEAIATSWKEQTLLNIVKLRYMDTPFFVDVPQITSGYTLQAAATGNGGIFPPVNPEASFAQQLGASLNLQGSYQDRPTISYAPQTGSQFIRNLTSPINPGSVLFLLQSGYPADMVFNLTVDSINGLRNRSVTGGQLRPADPDFIRVVQTLRKAQIAGHVGIRVQQQPEKKDAVAIFFRDKDVDPALAKELNEVRKKLRIDPERGEFQVVFGATAASPNEIAILSRSVLRILSELCTYVEVPVEHLASGTALDLGVQAAGAQLSGAIHSVAGERESGAGGTISGERIAASGQENDLAVPALLRVHSCSSKPTDPFVSVCYEGHWFWIDKSDFLSKRTLSYVLVLLAFADTGAKEGLPVITIQAN